MTALNVKTWNQSAPTAPTFVLIHGWSCSSSDWSPLIDRFRQRGNVLAVDLPGSGGSSDVPGPYTIPFAAEKVAEVMRERALPEAVLVGHSAGCEVAVAVAEDVSVAVSAIIAVDPAYGFAAEDKDRIRAIHRRLEQGDPRAIALEYFYNLDTAATPAFVKEAHPERIQATDSAIRGVFYEFAFGTGNFHFSPDCEERHHRRTVPMLAIYRNPVRASPASRFMSHPKDEVVIRSDAGHWLHLEDPDRFFGDMTSWLDALQRSDLGEDRDGVTTL